VNGHADDCPVTTTPDPDGMWWVLVHSDGWQHCESCHCTCDPDGPHCGHSAGCPGC
jgi:hypothetical protein